MRVMVSTLWGCEGPAPETAGRREAMSAGQLASAGCPSFERRIRRDSIQPRSKFEPPNIALVETLNRNPRKPGTGRRRREVEMYRAFRQQDSERVCDSISTGRLGFSKSRNQLVERS